MHLEQEEEVEVNRRKKAEERESKKLLKGNSEGQKMYEAANEASDDDK